MRHVIVRGFLGRKLRSALTGLAIVLGVAMIVGSSVLTAQIKGAFDGVFLQAYKKTDVVISKKASFKADGQETVPFAASVLDQVRRVDGVGAAVGGVGSIGAVPIVTENGKLKAIKPTGGAPAIGSSISGVPSLDPTTLVEGRQPSASGEISVERRTADRGHIKVGDHIGLASSTGIHPVTVVGIFSFAAAVGGSTQVALPLADAQRYFERVGKLDEIDVKASGVSAATLRDRIRAALPGYTARTGIEEARYQSAQVGSFVDVLGYALIAIGVVATLAGAFIIFNTFWITVGQRIKELALLRTLGASRRQLLTSVLVEAALVGVGASVVGILAGLGVAKGIAALFDAVGFGVPIGHLRLGSGTIVLALVIGIGVALVASFVPAFRSTRIPPVAAIREGAQLPAGVLARNAHILAPIVALVGLGLVAVGLFVASGTASVLIALGAGAFLLLVGVALTAPTVVPYLARTIGWPGERFGGIPGRIARENAERNPSRTAITAAALMIGIFLVSFVAVFAAGLKQSITDVLSTDIKAQYFVSAGGLGGGQTPLSPELAGQIAKVDGVAAVAPTSFAQARFQPSRKEVALSSAPPAFADAYRLRWIDGSDGTLRGLDRAGTIVDDKTAKAQGLHVGSSVTVKNRAGTAATFTVRGIVKSSQLVSGLLVAPAAFTPLADNKGVAFMFVVTRPGADQTKVKQAIEDVATKTNPLVDVQSNQDVIDQVSGQIDNVVIPLYALLAVIVLISVVGIVNTLLLSVFERTREIGLLRAVGTTRRQVRRMVRYESVITSVIGAALGVVVGVVFGGMVTYRLKDIPFVFPVGQVIVFFIVAIIAGVLAAIIPARRAARLNVLSALQYE